MSYNGAMNKMKANQIYMRVFTPDSQLRAHLVYSLTIYNQQQYHIPGYK